MFKLIVSNGRVADRTAFTRIGALKAASALEAKYGVAPLYIGDGSCEPAADDWTVSLPAGREQIDSLHRAVACAVEEQQLTVVINGTCPASLGSVPAVARHYPDLCLVWVDAHGDFNIPTTTDTGYLGGMVVSALCGLWDSGCGAGVRAENVILVGARDIDGQEQRLLSANNVRTLSPQQATADAVRSAIGQSKVWVHIDWDSLEPGYVPADYAVPDGLLPQQLSAILGAIPLEQIVGLEIAEFNASCDAATAQRATQCIIDIVDPLLSKACLEASVCHA
ncbi:arginase family protein [Pseudomonas sp. Irchel s3a10]|uniref:arginase family protein n=1 Tax=Pseudomonas sp. Irchel s3a10 TaxID=2009045 RepID=UPI000BA45C8B|nr:arginase family protein [Pseudomonas sp. Irchel s3a10]